MERFPLKTFNMVFKTVFNCVSIDLNLSTCRFSFNGYGTLFQRVFHIKTNVSFILSWISLSNKLGFNRISLSNKLGFNI